MSGNTNTSRWDDKSYLRGLKNPLVLEPLSQIINVSQRNIKQAVDLRIGGVKNIEVDRGKGRKQVCSFEQGYNHFSIPKSNGTLREISEPAPLIKMIQSEILKIVLSKVPTHMGAFAGDQGRSFVENAEIHVRNRPRFLVNIDLKDAYPSAFIDRIYENLATALSKTMQISFPELGAEEKEDIISIITLLLTCNGALPQGSPASMRLLNIILAQVDMRISKSIRGEDSLLHSAVYTRYVDDITIGWKDFKDTNQLWSKRTTMLSYLSELANILSGPSGSEGIIDNIGLISHKFQEIEDTIFVINNEKQRVEILGLCKAVESTLSNISGYPQLSEILNGIQERVTMFKQRVTSMQRENYTEAVAQETRKILIHEGWTVNDEKTKIRTPTSSAQKVVTGISIDSQGRMGIPKTTMSKFLTFMNLALDAPQDLAPEYQGNPKLIGETIVGMYQFVLQVKGDTNSTFRNFFNPCQKKYFPNRDLNKPAIGVKFKYDGEINIAA